MLKKSIAYGKKTEIKKLKKDTGHIASIAVAAMFLILSVEVISPAGSINTERVDDDTAIYYNCGDIITVNYTFTGDMRCSCGHGLIIGADGITIDGNGYTLDGVSPGVCDGFGIQRSGIYNPGHDDVIIKNLEIKNFCNGIYIRYDEDEEGIAYRNTIENCEVHHNGDASGGDTSTHGIKMVGVSDSIVKNCKIHHNTGKGNSCEDGGNGIFLMGTSSGDGGKRNLITHNEIYNNTKGGFFTKMKPERTNVTYNNITGNGQGGIILRCKKSATHIVECNNVTENYGTGVWIGGPNNTIRHNTITSNKNGSAYTGIVGEYGAGIKICRYEADNNEIFSNVVCGNDGVDIEVCADIGITGTTGDENTCGTTKNYDDSGTCGCTYRCISDLVIIEKSEEWIDPCQTYNIIYTIKNKGHADAGVSTTSIKIDGTEEVFDLVPGLAPGETYTATLGPFTITGNNDTIMVCVDIYSEVKECNEDNNCLENVFETLDIQPPISSVNQISPYWHNASPITIMAIANDTNSGVANVTLRYRFSLDNSTWNDWISFDIDDSEPWSWDFNFPAGEGYYEFYSIANDTASNNESAKSISEAFCAYETQSPTSSIDQISPYWRITSPLIISATVTDTGGSGVGNVTLLHRSSSENSTWSSWTMYGVDEAAPWMWEFNFSTGDKFYEFYSIAVDSANNIEDTPAIADAFCGYDTTPPIIMLNSPANNSIIQPSTVIDLGIIEGNLNIINYSIDNGADKTFSPPYDIDTSSWIDGMHSIKVHVDDKVGNIAVRSYIFTIDGTAPVIVSTIPANNAVNVAIDTTIIIEFNESMERSSVESSISTSPTLNVSRYSWNSDNTTLTITFASDLTRNTTYLVTVDIDAKDAAGNPMSSAYSWVFTTWINTNNDSVPESEETPDWFRGVVLIIIILIVVLFAFYRKRV